MRLNVNKHGGYADYKHTDILENSLVHSVMFCVLVSGWISIKSDWGLEVEAPSSPSSFQNFYAR